MRPKRLFGKAAAAAIAVSLVAAPLAAHADDGGGGGVSGPAGSDPNYKLYVWLFDEVATGATTPVQGYMQNSTEYLLRQATGTHPVVSNTGAMDRVRQACNIALGRAEARGGNQGKSRVVSILWVGSTTNAWEQNSSAAASNFTNAWSIARQQGYPGIHVPRAIPYLDTHFNEGVADLGGGNGSAVCVALNQDEPPQNYNLNVQTDKAQVFSKAGTTTPVSDTLHASISGGADVAENLNGNIWLNWDGREGNNRAVSKPVTFPNKGDTTSPEFTPSDFGWNSWPAGKFWFDVDVPKQGMMAAAVNTPDRDPRETWEAAPLPPVKQVTSGSPEDELQVDSEVLASGMFYNARISATPNGYASEMHIFDTTLTDEAWIGARDRDDVSKVYVEAPDGTRVKTAVTNISRSGGKIVVSAKITNIPDAFQSRAYTLVVPTYFKPTKRDYSLTDESKVCYTAAITDCLTGNDKTVRKVTPRPDKVWVLDENGALVAADPRHTNTVGADEKVFLPGDAVSAVVNGRVPAHLAEDFDAYKLVDKWAKAAKYVDFSNKNLAKVFYETQPGSGAFDDVTGKFNITVSGTTTTANALPSFLKGTKGQSGDRATKLVISGKFRTDYRTKGETVKLYNEGAEWWNNEEIETNVPAVYTWTPDPPKDVVGDAREDGDKTHSSINGLYVFPGKHVEYSVGVDLRVPSDTARGVKTLAVKDVYDPLFIPDKDSVEFWDSRDPKNPRPVPRKFYSLKFDDAQHQFVATFTEEWVKQNVTLSGANSEWNTKGWLTMRFTGRVSDTAQLGDIIENQAFQIINGVEFETNPVDNPIPPITPDKEDLNTELDSIDGKTVVKGDTILYRLTLDAGPALTDSAYFVHKLGMVDDFDEKYVSVNAKDIRLVDIASGEDVTSKFNTQVADGKMYTFAKQVDSYDAYGELIPGNPQPEDLAEYADADIIPGKTPIIDQGLLGRKFWVLMPATVIRETDGYVIKNQARENIENNWITTKIVSNPLKDIDPDKDVIVKGKSGEDVSVHEGEIKLNSMFDYRLDSSRIPANRAYKASQWGITDSFDRTHDLWTGVWAIYAAENVYDGEKLIYKKGDLLQDSENREAEDRAGLFTVTWDEAAYKLSVEAGPELLRLVNTRGDLPAAWRVYVKMERIAPGEKVLNTLTETYNNVERASREVWTETPEHPSIETVKYTLREGATDGDRDDLANALQLTKDEVKDGVKVGFTFTNTGDVPLKEITFSDVTEQGMQGTVTDIMCRVPESMLPSDTTNSGDTTAATVPGAAGVQPVMMTPEGAVNLPTEPLPTADSAASTGSADASTAAAAEGPVVERAASELADVVMQPGDTISCEGTLTGMSLGSAHRDTVTVTGKSTFTGKQVHSSDPWSAKAPSETLPVTGGQALLWMVGAAAVALGAAAVVLAAARRSSRKEAAETAEAATTV